MKRLLVSITICICLVFTSGSVFVFADPEDGEWTEGEETTEEWTEESEETWDETSEETTEETDEEVVTEETEEVVEETYEEETTEEGEDGIVYSGGNEYSGEYAEGYSEEEAYQQEEEGYEDPVPVTTEDGHPIEEVEEEFDANGAKKPIITSGSAAVYCRNTGELIFAKNGDKRFSPYSITKLLTAFLAVQKLPMDQKVVISAAAASQGGSSMWLVEGEELTVEQLLYGTMILSGNDAAYALGETVSGDIDSFIDLMNETVENIGCKNTHFVNPNGLIDDISLQYTSANDFLEISKHAFANETLCKIAGANSYKMAATNMSEAYTMTGHNELLLAGRDGYIAGKTGYWDDTKATIAMDYRYGNLELIVVALGGDVDKRADDCDRLVDYALANIHGLKVVDIGEVVASVRVNHGAVTKVDAATNEECYIYLPKQASKELIQLTAETVQDLTAPVTAGDVIGTYQVFIGDEKIAEVPLIAVSDVEEGWVTSYIGLSNRATAIICFVLFVILFLIILRLISRGRAKRKASK